MTMRQGPFPLRAWRASACALLILLSGAGREASGASADPDSFVRVRVETANLREGPSREADLVRYAHESEPLEVVDRQGTWLKVRDFDGQLAWIHEPLTDDRSAVVVTRDLVNVRVRPGTGHPIAFTAERGVNLLVLGREGQWLHVEHDVGQGWVHGSLVWGDP
jgi:SH3-like domain-containing protein